MSDNHADEVPTRHGATRIAIFNHKGGVGKTTLTVNIGAALASRGHRVLLIDSDPQCSLTSYLVEESVVDDLLDKSETEEGRTLWSAVKPVDEGKGPVRIVEPYETSTKDLFYLPGDLLLAAYESHLARSWAECFERRIRAYSEVTALSQVANSLAEIVDAEYVFYDSGPNVGPLNRVILLDSDYFIIPAACDLFSLRALKTLGQTLRQWITEWDTISMLAPDGVYLLPGKPKFLGYVPQNFRVYGGTLTQAFAKFLPRLEKNLRSEVMTLLERVDSSLVPTKPNPVKLGEIQDCAGLVNESQQEGVPLWAVTGGNASLKEVARKSFDAIADKIVDLTVD